MNKILTLQPDIKFNKEDFDKINNEDLRENESGEDNYKIMKTSHVLHILFKNKAAAVSICIILMLTLFAFLGPLILKYTYYEQLRGFENLSPSLSHPFGTDGLGRDIMVRAMYATRISILIGIVSSVIVLIIGTVYGAVSGYFAGAVDNVMMRIADLVYSMPDVIVVILLSIVLKQPLYELFNNSSSAFIKSFALLGPGVIAIFAAFALLYWVTNARIIRGHVLVLREQDYITAAKAIGCGRARIIRKHIIPNCASQMIVTTCLMIPSAIFLESFLSFLGLGVSAPMTSLGSMINEAMDGIYSYTYRLIIPCIILCVLILCLNVLGDKLRDAFDYGQKATINEK